ncbi:hypothetical protein BMF94_4082 [Rhodotorula taiwanensis]|uniref:Uncharacterized protein n=1 Tax=Rhodotorula taiwanensis TaxID=741276 RepID=A0A2S5B874_9BASI|nr:hypothetical protein BMF94_4082 [Rhodotorula taiwanensis]
MAALLGSLGGGSHPLGSATTPRAAQEPDVDAAHQGLNTLAFEQAPWDHMINLKQLNKLYLAVVDRLCPVTAAGKRVKVGAHAVKALSPVCANLR